MVYYPGGMKLFGFKQKPKGSLGVDFGAGGIKIVQLQPKDGRKSLFTYGFSELSAQEKGSDYLAQPEAAGLLLKEVCTRARTTVTDAVAALPIPAVFSTVLSVPLVEKKELAAAVEREAKKLLPAPPETMQLEFREIQLGDADTSVRKNRETNAIEVLLTAAPKDLIQKYAAIAKIAGLTLTTLETEAFALIRSLVGTDPAPAIILDIGAYRSNILFVDRGVPMLTRSVEVGGQKCTDAIAEALHVSPSQAEMMKRDLAASPLAGSSPGALPLLLREIFSPLINELKYSFTMYQTQNTVARPPERIILAGGGSGLPGLQEILTSEFNMRVFVGNPWERVDVHPDLAPLLSVFASRFAVALGLALRSLA